MSTYITAERISYFISVLKKMEKVLIQFLLIAGILISWQDF